MTLMFLDLPKKKVVIEPPAVDARQVLGAKAVGSLAVIPLRPSEEVSRREPKLIEPPKNGVIACTAEAILANRRGNEDTPLGWLIR